MKHSLKVGFSFGLTSGIITTLGLMVGLNSSTHSKLVVLGGIITIAVADALSDATGIHVSQEAQAKYSQKQVWEATLSTLFAKFFFALTFIVPVLLLDLSKAIIAGVIWGLSLLGVFSYYVAKKENIPPWRVIAEHLAIALLVILTTHFIGKLISSWFG